jgi:hypothetical protein
MSDVDGLFLDRHSCSATGRASLKRWPNQQQAKRWTMSCPQTVLSGTGAGASARLLNQARPSLGVLTLKHLDMA